MTLRIFPAPAWRARCAAFLFALSGAGALAQGRPLAPEELYEQVAPSVWLVEARRADGKGSLGSAVVIAPGVLVTNCHVVENAQEISVSHLYRDRRRVPARLQLHDPTRDLCQLVAPGVPGPSVLRAPADSLRPGAKVFAIGNPRGLELTISDGLVSGLRRDDAGRLERVQISVPISPGSSGGGLFDVQGRLVGITTSGLRDSQNLNFAMPAEWIVDLPLRAAGKLPPPSASDPAVAIAAAPPAPAAPQTVLPPADPPATTAPAAMANTFEYRHTDRYAKSTRQVVYHVDRRDGERLVLNGGSRIEETGGRVVSDSGLIGGEFDLAMPPGGWVHGALLQQRAWKVDYRKAGANGKLLNLQVQARTLGESTLRVQGRDLRVVEVEFTGYTERGSAVNIAMPGRYTAHAWYAPDLGRVARFEARSRGGLGGATYRIDEVIELVDLRSE